MESWKLFLFDSGGGQRRFFFELHSRFGDLEFPTFFVAQTVLARVQIPPLHEFFGIRNERAIRRRVCTFETDRAIIEGVS